MKTLFLLRGIPGSGKSSLAKMLSSALSSHYEADMYFVDEHGNYNFDASKLRDAHEWCRRQVESDMGPLGLNEIFVTNTFTTESELKPYYELAEKYGYRVFSLIVENRHGGINEHNVPQETLDKMRKRFNISL